MNGNDHLIEIQDLGREYMAGDTTVSAIKEMSFFIDDGEFVSIVGQSGAGKSTLLAALGGLNRPTRGNVWVDTMDLYGLSSEQRADFRSEYVGFVFQSYQLITYLTAMENVKIPLSIAGVKKEDQADMAAVALEKVGLQDKKNRLPDQLSGGEQERVAIARAIVNRPPIVLADEPTGNLDSKTADDVINLLKQLNQEGQTVIMVTHNKKLCQHTDRTVHVRDGLCVIGEG
ncbi:MAG: ABC transporter ATP-binding protein [Deltaproteobacteria bacterium]|nr:ABC transporter ATP-binding protein [Deltaproteobacteria bacterium]MBW2298183.1 ABC transporter ATP-binding protein [Deltaproteobacteria bacterium]MBW2612764.1 ABC transporter ATP-binding protein [Deltaproteobacteria bacterium]MBW2632900.1 ABC transporter ATP-binding protein [Deltaproteobacteria bacterium]MBW2677907.1 ABC transporter ATP-binding protein [Deltaproteobacteria bacterium]